MRFELLGRRQLLFEFVLERRGAVRLGSAEGGGL
jgi:hypothetical protein